MPLFYNRIKEQIFLFDDKKNGDFFSIFLHASKNRQFFKCNILLGITSLIPEEFKSIM